MIEYYTKPKQRRHRVLRTVIIMLCMVILGVTTYWYVSTYNNSPKVTTKIISNTPQLQTFDTSIKSKLVIESISEEIINESTPSNDYLEAVEEGYIPLDKIMHNK